MEGEENKRPSCEEMNVSQVREKFPITEFFSPCNKKNKCFCTDCRASFFCNILAFLLFNLTECSTGCIPNSVIKYWSLLYNRAGKNGIY